MAGERSSPRFVIAPAVPEDAPALVRVTEEAMDLNVLSAFIFTPSVYREGRRREAWHNFLMYRIELAFNNPNTHLLKATDSNTNQIVGFVGWTFLNGDEAELQPPNPATSGERHPQDAPPLKVELDVNMEMMNAAFVKARRMRGDEMRGHRHAYLSQLMILPKFQHAGIGSALTRWGLDRADEEQIESYVVSFPEPRIFYEKHDFEITNHVELDLAEVRGDWNGYGIWRQYNLLRKPKKVGEPAFS